MAKTIAQIATQIETIEARLVTLRTQLAQAQAKDVTLEPGQDISFNYGRGETRSVKSGKVVGENIAENGVKFVKVCVGEGFSAEFFTVRKVDVLLDIEESGDEAPASSDAAA